MTQKSETLISATAISPKKPLLTNEIFKDRKELPELIKGHKIFREPHKFSKIFPSLGLSNFEEPCALVRPLLDMKKDNFVSTLITALGTHLNSAKDAAQYVTDSSQFLEVKEGVNLEEACNLVALVRGIAGQLDAYNNAFERVVQQADGRIVLRLADNVNDLSGKAVFKKGEGIFKVFGKLKEAFQEQKLAFVDLEQTNEFKNFCAENVPNKSYQVVFTSDGKEGAWDLLTMSMRGFKSCQRWDAAESRSLIGSVLSKFVGIIYITSGADFEGKGPKMMRRSVVRYAIDADSQEPCLLIDKIYPPSGAEVDEETINIFTKALTGKTSIPVHFAPKLGNKVRHFYVPFEKIREEIPEKDWSYQDTPLKTSLDYQMHIIASASNEDFNRYTSLLRDRLTSVLSEFFRKSFNNSIVVEKEMQTAFNNIRLNGSVSTFNQSFVKNLLDCFHHAQSSMVEPEEAFRKYLLALISQLKTVQANASGNLTAIIQNSTSRNINCVALSTFLIDTVIKPQLIVELKGLTK